MTHYQALMGKYRDDEQFRRLAMGPGSVTFAELSVEAIMKDRTGQDHWLAPHNAPGVDVIASDGTGLQVKTINSAKSIVMIHRGRDHASEVVIFANFLKPARFFRVPMAEFKTMARPYDSKGRAVERSAAERWELTARRIAAGALDQFEVTL